MGTQLKLSPVIYVVPSHSSFGYQRKTGKYSVIWLLLKINVLTTMLMSRSRREISIDVLVIDYLQKLRFSPVLPFRKQGWGHLKQALIFAMNAQLL